MPESSSPTNVKGPQVFINFRGADLRYTFVTDLSDALKRRGINAFIDNDMIPGENLETLYRKIDESTVALAIVSSRYTESHWCLNELVKIKECVDRGTLWVIPIFYQLKTSIVHDLDGDFGLQLWNLWRKKDYHYRDDRILKWDAALQDVGGKKALKYEENSDDVVNEILKHVENFLTKGINPEPQGSGGESPNPHQGSNLALNSSKPGERRLEQLEEKLDMECNDSETRIVGLVGMTGIGKTYLAEELSKKLKRKISCYVFIKARGLDKRKLQQTLVQGLLKINCSNENELEVWKGRLAEKKVAVVLDDVSDKEQVNAILGNRNWLQKGSRIVITTRDKSLLNGLTCDLYEVPKLNDKDSIELFSDQICTTLEGKFMELARKFVDYAGGNPLALKEFGVELYGKDEAHWETRLGTLTQRIRTELRISYDELNVEEKDAFLDIAYFFRSQDENYIRSLLDSFDHESTDIGKVIRGLADKFLISVCNGRVEMQDLLFTMAKELVEATPWKYKLLSPSNYEEFTSKLKNKEGRDKVRGMILDMSKMEEMPLDNQVFFSMSSLRYLKVYDPGHNEATCKLNLPDELEFPEDNIVRYFHWTKFAGKKLPSDFKPKNLIDLRLPYSKLTILWNRNQVAPKLKWVDLSYSSKLTSIASLSDAPNLLRLNLEGCISLERLPREMKKMKNLVFLNLRGCTRLLCLPDITMDSLKTLILSDCSNLHTFDVISEHLESVYLNGTSIYKLPPAIGNLHKLILLNLKDCKNLATLPDCLGKLKYLQQIKLSRCSKIKIFPDFKENMENLWLLFVDGTSITEMPCNVINLSFLQSLCLSRNDNIRSLQFDMSQLFHLKWLELKYCKNLTSLSKLPPNLQCLNAYGCTSLKTVANPLALPTSTKQIQSTFIFTNCHELEQVSKNAIISYIQNKSELMSEDQYNKDFIFKSLIGTCFPGCDIPAWFNHQAFGSVLKLDFPRDWNEGRLNGIALCVVVSFKDYKDENNGLQVKCHCEFTSGSLSRESFIIGGWSEPDDEQHTIVTDHVFIGYTTFFNLKKRQQFSAATEVSLGFEVTNGTYEVVECKVMKCGFTLVYESDYTSWEGNIDATTRMENGTEGQTSLSSYKGTKADDDCLGEANSGRALTIEESKNEKGFLKSIRKSFR